MKKQANKIVASILSFVLCVSSLTFGGCEFISDYFPQFQGGIQTPNEGGNSGENEAPSNDPVGAGFEFTVNSSQMHTDLQLAYLNDSYNNI